MKGRSENSNQNNDAYAEAKPLFKDKSRRVKRKRAWELDFFRGLAVLAMCFDHTMADFTGIHRWFSNYWKVGNPFIDNMRVFALSYWNSSKNYTSGFRFWGHVVFIFIFLFLVGVSCAFSRDNARRGAEVTVASAVFTGITFWILKPMGFMTYGVVFGILQCIAMCILICAAVDNITKFNKYVNLFAPLVIGTIILSFAIYKHAWIGPPSDARYGFTFEHFSGYVLGTYRYGDDWFGLFPYIGFVFMGMFFGKAAYPTRESLLPGLDGKWNKPFCFIGRHALLCYFIHQIIIAGIIIIACLCMGYELAF